MSIKEYWNFANESSVPSGFTSITGGSGSVAISSNHLQITPGGTTSSDYAAAVYNTAIDQTKMYIIYGELKMSGTVTTWVPVIVGLIDSSGTPAAMTAANRDANLRVWHEYQMSSGGDSSDLIQAKVKDSAATEYIYRAATDDWGTTGTTRAYFDEDSYYRFVLIYDGTPATAQARLCVFGYTEGNKHGWALNYDSTWLDFTTGAGNIDPADNDLWVIFGDPTNDESKSTTVTFDYRRIMIGEIVETNPHEFAWMNNGTGSHPIPYDLFMYVNPMPDDQTCWIPRNQEGTSADISRGSDHWVKDMFVHLEGSTWWGVYQLRKAADGKSYLQAVSKTDILNGSWSAATEISDPGSEDGHNFPWWTRWAGTWYCFYGVDESGGSFHVEYMTTTATSPTSGWGSATTVVSAGSPTDWDDGGAHQPFLIWYSGNFTTGVWYIMYGGYDGASWQSGFAKSTTGITGTYTKDAGNPFFANGGGATLIDGTMTDTAQITVDSTSGFSVGEHIYIDTPDSQYEILSVDSGTTMTVQIEVTEADNQPVQLFSYNSIAMRFLRFADGYWRGGGTPFKFNGGEEGTGYFVETTGATDPAAGTYRLARFNDTAIDSVIPVSNMYEDSVENIMIGHTTLAPIINRRVMVR